RRCRRPDRQWTIGRRTVPSERASTGFKAADAWRNGCIRRSEAKTLPEREIERHLLEPVELRGCECWPDLFQCFGPQQHAFGFQLRDGHGFLARCRLVV